MGHVTEKNHHLRKSVPDLSHLICCSKIGMLIQGIADGDFVYDWGDFFLNPFHHLLC
jgi:hypothetical protein